MVNLHEQQIVTFGVVLFFTGLVQRLFNYAKIQDTRLTPYNVLNIPIM